MAKTIALLGANTARALLRSEQRSRQQPPASDGRRQAPPYIPEGIPFQNTGTATIGPYELMRVDDSVDFNGTQIATCKLPDNTFATRWLVNGPDEVAQNDLGTAQVGPIVLFAYDTGNPAAKEIFGPKSGQGTASQGHLGLLQVIKIHDSANKLARGWLRTINSLTGKADVDVPALSGDTPGSGTLTIWSGTDSGPWAATTMTCPVLNFSAQVGTAAKFLTTVETNGIMQLIFESCGA